MCLSSCGAPKTLAIIGNGFDMAHGYKTSYSDFSKKTTDHALIEFKRYCDEESIKTWYLFENNLNKLTRRFFMRSYQEDVDYDVQRDKNTYLRKIFSQIQSLLVEYLSNEVCEHPLTKIKSISKYLNKNTVAINFNYTNTVENYTDKVFYVHGSLHENDIILGYDYRDEACLALFDDICWGKSLCREALAFRRMLHNDLGLRVDNPEFEMLCSSLETYQSCENSGRGIDDEVESYISNFALVDEFIKKYRADYTVPNIDYTQIARIVVLGHGIESDQVYLNNIISMCANVKQIVLFRYKGEDDESFNDKKEFLKQYCPKIKTVYY